MKIAVRLPLTALLLGAFGLNIASAQTAADILTKLDASQKNVKDLSFRLAGTATLDGSPQKIDLKVQSIPSAALARVVFAAPDSLADNILVVSKNEVRNYLYLTNQVTVTSTSKAAGNAGMTGLDLTQVSNFSSFLKAYERETGRHQWRSRKPPVYARRYAQDLGCERRQGAGVRVGNRLAAYPSATAGQRQQGYGRPEHQ
ncbi:hypothetical protein [Deinococcus sp. KNUC1210]|uniref:hypothetical protein n=1 Tax=Deinococcus sp. KNUC1210 TaxID=2917691 RepID=UPI00351D7B0B